MLIYNSVITEAVMRTWLHGQAVKTLASHAGIRGSIPLGVTKKALETGLFFVFGNQEVIKKVIRHMFDYLIHKKEEDLHI